MEAQVSNPVVMADKFVNLSTIFGVPDSYRLVSASTRDEIAYLIFGYYKLGFLLLFFAFFMIFMMLFIFFHLL